MINLFKKIDYFELIRLKNNEKPLLIKRVSHFGKKLKLTV
jgi:hypothetical protein